MAPRLILVDITWINLGAISVALYWTQEKDTEMAPRLILVDITWSTAREHTSLKLSLATACCSACVGIVNWVRSASSFLSLSPDFNYPPGGEESF